MSRVSLVIERAVRERAQGRCEYCLYPEAFAIKRHEIDHIIAKKHRGQDAENNLCLSCIDCNRHRCVGRAFPS
jgi:5-methylcytosine-specific restriction endonuclease McrA